ncbi:MAG TPA: hypothetical protein VK872_06005 [Draconibacterium sp.]|jgi:hypothetical protein|nr:hypothetical protein [Draconibacterium sp.]
MEKKYTKESLQEAIKALEIKQAEEGQLLKSELLNTYENLKPINILRNIIKEFYSTDKYKQDFVEIVAGMTTGFLTKKIVVGKSKNPFLKIIGLAIQFGVTTFFSNKYNALKDSAIQLISRFLDEKEVKTEHMETAQNQPKERKPESKVPI